MGAAAKHGSLGHARRATADDDGDGFEGLDAAFSGPARGPPNLPAQASASQPKSASPHSLLDFLDPLAQDAPADIVLSLSSPPIQNATYRNHTSTNTPATPPVLAQKCAAAFSPPPPLLPPPPRAPSRPISPLSGHSLLD